MPTKATRASCRWLRAVPWPATPGDGPHHRCGNLGSPHFAEPVAEAFACGSHERGRGSFMVDLGMGAPANDRA